MSAEVQTAVKALLGEFGDAVAPQLGRLGLPPHSSPIFRPFSLVVLRDGENNLVGFSPVTGRSNLVWLDQQTQPRRKAKPNAGAGVRRAGAYGGDLRCVGQAW